MIISKILEQDHHQGCVMSRGTCYSYSCYSSSFTLVVQVYLYWLKLNFSNSSFLLVTQVLFLSNVIVWEHLKKKIWTWNSSSNGVGMWTFQRFWSKIITNGVWYLGTCYSIVMQHSVQYSLYYRGYLEIKLMSKVAGDK